MKKAALFLMVLMMIPLTARSFETVKWDNGVELGVYGFFQNNTALFTQNPNPWGPDTGHSNNRLAVERTWARLNVDLKVNEQFRFFGNGQWAYEPWLPVETGSVSHKGDDQWSMYNNVNDVLREAYFEWKPTKTNNIRAGRMNVIWGEAIGQRVGDVVNPSDYRWSLPMSVEDTENQRVPQYMLRGIHDVEALSSSLEWIVSPILTSPEWSVSMGNQSAVLAQGIAGQRFGAAPETRIVDARSIGNTALAALNPAFAVFGNPDVVLVSPTTSGWVNNPLIFPGTGWGPFLVQPTGPTSANLVTEVPDVKVKYPDGMKDTRFGFRTNTLAGGYGFGVMYYHRQVFEPLMKREDIVSTVTSPGPPLGPFSSTSMVTNTRRYVVEFPDVDNIGIYVNKALPWPGVIRAEAVYTPNMPFNRFLPTQTVIGPLGPTTTFAEGASGVTRRDDFKYLFAYDLQGFFYPDWHKTAPFDVIFEHTGEWIPNARDLQYVTSTWYGTKIPSWQGTFTLQVMTNWFYNKLSTQVAFIYNTFGNSRAIVPAVKWMPSWQDNKFSMELKYVYIDGDSRAKGFGGWMDKDYVQLKTQLTF